jgi:hypothetical protein
MIFEIFFNEKPVGLHYFLSLSTLRGNFLLGGALHSARTAHSPGVVVLVVSVSMSALASARLVFWVQVLQHALFSTVRHNGLGTAKILLVFFLVN